jgi:Ni,Fe-hydrogenase I cytochrome b subunit
MITDSFFTFACAGVIGVLFGTILTFTGYRFFLFLLPVWGFFFGLGLGAQSVQALFGDGFLSTITSWVVGFVIGALFALLSYIFYAFAVAIIGGSLGYVLTVGLLTWIGLPFGFIVWLIGLIVGVIAAFVTIRFNLQKWVVIAATSILGSATIFGTIMLMFNPAATLLENPVRVFLQTSPFLMILFLLVAGLGIFVQISTTRAFEVDVYNRVSEGSV